MKNKFNGHLKTRIAQRERIKPKGPSLRPMPSLVARRSLRPLTAVSVVHLKDQIPSDQVLEQADVTN